MSKDNKDVKRGIVLYIDGKGIENSVSSIKKELRKLTKELEQMTVGSEEYQAQMAKIRNLNAVLQQHKTQLRGVTDEAKRGTLSFGKLVDGFNRFGGFVATAAATLTGFVLGIRSLRDELNKLETAQHGLKALTGLDDESIDWLTKRAKQLSTTMTDEGLRVRQSADEILDAFMLVGSAKAELLDDREALASVTEEAMRLQAAAGDISLNEAVDALTLALNQYGDQADQAARYSNVLAAGAQAGAASIASQAASIRRAGTAAASANVPIEQTVALIQLLAYKGITDEVAGTGLKKFFLVLQTGAEETNPAIVGLDQALDNLAKKNLGAADIKKMFGEEGFNTASVIINNTKQVREYTQAVTGTNLATEQAAINSDTAAAALDQARNKMKLAGIELAEKLSPAITVSTNAMTYVIKILPGLIDWLREWGGAVTIASATILIYATRLRIATTAMTAYNAVVRIATALQAAYNVVMNTSRGYTITAITDMRKLISVMGNHRVALNAIRIATSLYAATLHLLHGRLDLTAKSLRVIGAIMAANPITLLATVVGGAAAAAYLLNKRMKDYYDIQKITQKLDDERARQIEEQTARINTLKERIDDNNLSTLERKKAIEELRKIIPDYHAEIDEEGKIFDENTAAIDRYNKMLAVNIDLKNTATELDTHRISLNRLRKSPALEDNSLMGAMARENVRQKIADEEAVIASLTARYKDLVKEKYRLLNPSDNADNKNDNDHDDDSATGNLSAQEPEKKSAADKEIERLDAEHYAAMTALKQRYINDDTMSQEQYNHEVQQAELQLLDQKLAVMGVEESKRKELNNKLLDLQMKLKDQRLDEMNKETQTILTAEQKRFQLELTEEMKALKNKKITREEFLSSLNKLYRKYVTQLPDLPNIVTDDQKKAIDEYINKIKDLVKTQTESANNAEDWANRAKNAWSDANKWTSASNDEMMAAMAALIGSMGDMEMTTQEKLEAMGTITMSFAAQFGSAIGQALAGSEDAIGEFFKSCLTMLIEFIQRSMIAYIAETTMRNIAASGPWGLAEAAVEIALITAAGEALKSIVTNFWSGGYTGPGSWDQPQGIVHSNEFVANRFAVANPQVRPVLDLIDQAQRSGSVSNLTGEDIAAVSGTRSVYQQAVVQPQVVRVEPSNNNDQIIAELAATMRDLKSKLDEPMPVYNNIAGDNGIKRKIDRYQQLVNNKSRQYKNLKI